MGDQQLPRTDLRALLESVEAAAPTAAIEVVTHELAVMVGARAVSFLIADFSGHAVVRFGKAKPGADRRDAMVFEAARRCRSQTLSTSECCGLSRWTFPVSTAARK